MCPAAFMAAETADAQPDDAVRGLQTTQVIAMDREAGRMAACTCELMELGGGKDVIIYFWFKGLRISTDKVIISM